MLQWAGHSPNDLYNRRRMRRSETVTAYSILADGGTYREVLQAVGKPYSQKELNRVRMNVIRYCKRLRIPPP